MQVSRRFQHDSSVISPQKILARVKAFSAEKFEVLLLKIFRKLANTSSYHSFSLLPSRLHHHLNGGDMDVIHMHWVCKGMISIKEIGKISKPLVWTLHDMWPFCGSEHCSTGTDYRDGYAKKGTLNLERWLWKKKMTYWQNPFQIITPSHWLASCVKKSLLMKDWPVAVIPNCLDMEAWKSWDKLMARKKLNFLDDGSLFILFGADGGTSNPLKGFHLLESALKILYQKNSFPQLKVVVFGGTRPSNPPDIGFPIQYLGYLNDESILNLHYSAADLTVVPSKIESFGYTALESLASGTPVVAFNTSGLPDIVQHKENGYLAKPFEAEDLACGISWVLENRERHRQLCHAARNHAEKNFSYPVVARQHERLYQEVLNRTLR